MAYWLVKSEPGDWSWQDQLATDTEPWDGVRNSQAQKNMRAMRPEDKVFFYHSGKTREIIGVCAVARGPYPDPDDDTGRFCLVDLKATESATSPIALAAVKADARLAHIALVRQARLSVMPIDAEAWQLLYNMGKFC